MDEYRILKCPIKSPWKSNLVAHTQNKRSLCRITQKRVLFTGITFARCIIEFYCTRVGVKSVRPFYGHVTQSVKIAVNAARRKIIRTVFGTQLMTELTRQALTV